jgi:hypothetical protein
MTVHPSLELERRIEHLAEERIALFARAGTEANTSDVDRSRLKVVERELDECFLALRSERAKRDATRFVTEQPVLRTRIPRPKP